MPKQKGYKPRLLYKDCVEGTWVRLHKWPVMTKLGVTGWIGRFLFAI
jgi:hypothetical protein